MNEIARLKALNEYEIMDTLPEKEFDDIAELASAVCNTPMSIVSFIDSERQWYKAKIGLQNDDVPLEQTFCQHSIVHPNEVMVIPNATLDDRTKYSPYTTGPANIRSYVSVPILAHGGEAIGTLCVIDTEPRNFGEEQLQVLRILGKRVTKYLDMRKENLIRKAEADEANRKLQEAVSQLKGAQKISRFGSWECDLSNMHITWSSEMYGLFDIEEGTPVSMKTWRSKVHTEDLGKLLNTISKVVATCKPQVSEYRVIKGDECIWHLATADIIADETGKPIRMVGTIMDITLSKTADEHRAQYVHTLEEMLFAISHKLRKPVANYQSIANVLKSKNLSPEQVMECVPYIDGFAHELDGYIHELNDFLHDKRLQLNVSKKVA